MSPSATTCYDGDPERQDRHGEIHSIGEVLEELLSQYEARFPDVNITIVETAATTAA